MYRPVLFHKVLFLIILQGFFQFLLYLQVRLHGRIIRSKRIRGAVFFRPLLSIFGWFYMEGFILTRVSTRSFGDLFLYFQVVLGRAYGGYGSAYFQRIDCLFHDAVGRVFRNCFFVGIFRVFYGVERNRGLRRSIRGVFTLYYHGDGLWFVFIAVGYGYFRVCFLSRLFFVKGKTIQGPPLGFCRVIGSWSTMNST